MVPLPAALDPDAPLLGWRIDRQPYASNWDSGAGAERYGGRWNPRGVKVVYASLDPATCLVEAAVHRGFRVLDTEPHMLTSFEVIEPSSVRVVRADDLPNPAWLQGSLPSAGQQQWGAALLGEHAFVLLPSAVSRHSWNLIFDPERARGLYTVQAQDRLVVDTRLNPAVRAS